MENGKKWFGGEEYYAFSYPIYDKEDKCFYHEVWDLDDNSKDELAFFCDLEELQDREDYEEIKKLFDIED